jgi:hypothetical protein
MGVKLMALRNKVSISNVNNGLRRMNRVDPDWKGWRRRERG